MAVNSKLPFEPPEYSSLLRGAIPLIAHAIVEFAPLIFDKKKNDYVRDETRISIYDSRQERACLISIDVDLTTDKTSEATVKFADPKFVFTDRHLDETRMQRLPARIWLFYGDDPGEPCFKGLLAGHEHDGLTASFRFHDQGAKLKTEKKQRYHNRKSDFTIMRSVAEEHGLKFSLVGTATDSEAHESLVQQGVTDWELIKTIAGRAGLRVWVDGDTLFAQEVGVNGSAAQTITYLEDFLLVRPVNFSYKLPENRRGRYSSVEVHGRASGGHRLTGTDEEDGRGRQHQGAREDLTHHTEHEATRRAHGKRRGVKEQGFEHRIRLLPAPGGAIRLRSVVRLAGCGQFYSGNYVVHCLHREFKTGKLLDELTLRRDLGKQQQAKGH